MELEEAFNIIFDESKKNEAINWIKKNKEESTKNLIKILKNELNKIENNQNLDIIRINKILKLLGILEAKETFLVFQKIIEYNILGIELDQVYKIIPDESNLKLLIDYATDQNRNEIGRLLSYLLVCIFYQTKNQREDIVKFFKNLISTFKIEEFNTGNNLSLLFNIIEHTLYYEYNILFKDLENILIKSIILSKDGKNDSWFENYFKYLYQINPLIKCKITEIKKYIFTLKKCIDDKIFKFDNFKDIGKYFFEKILEDTKTESNIAKIAIKLLRQKEFNERLQPTKDEEYYEEICFYLSMRKIPKEVYEQANKLYNEIFRIKYSKLKENIEEIIEKIKIEKIKVEEENEKIIENSNKNATKGESILKNIENDKKKLVYNYFFEKELNVIYKENSYKEYSGLLPYYLKKIKEFLNKFCNNIDNSELVDKKIKEISIQFSFSDYKVEDYFLRYSNALEGIGLLIGDTPTATLYKLFYKIKFIPFFKKIRKKYYKFNEDSTIQKMQLEIENHPLYHETLMKKIDENIEDYHLILESYLDEIISSIKEILSKSVCLKKRKQVIEYCLDLVKEENNELLINLLPIQIEGLFIDLLEYSEIYEYINNIELYQTILNLELVKKIDFGIQKDINIYLETEAYFKYYFNSVIRNTIAHGNYKILMENRINIFNKNNSCIKNNNDIIERIFVLELLLDLNYLINSIYEINEIDTVVKYIEFYSNKNFNHSKIEEKSSFYDLLFEDLNGTRERLKINEYKPKLFVIYEPMQIIYWIFNPYYEKYLDKEIVFFLRTTICSLDFWEYVNKKIDKEIEWNKKIKEGTLKKIIKKIFYLVKKRDEVIDKENIIKLLGKINEKLY